MNPIGNAPALRDRLCQMADDCEERARLSDSADARSLFHRAATDARLIARTPCIAEDGLRLALERTTSEARFAAWLSGDALPETPTSPAQCTPTFEGHRPQPDAVSRPSDSPAPPEGAMIARQLAETFGVPERTARRAIERGVRKGLPGFYCIPNGVRTRWLAEVQAFGNLHSP